MTFGDSLQRSIVILLKMYEEPDYKKGIGKKIILNLVNSNIFFMEKTKQLFSEP